MNQTYRQTELENANKELAAARIRMSTAKTNKARREAAEDIEFWSSKTAFFSNIHQGAFQDER